MCPRSTEVPASFSYSESSCEYYTPNTISFRMSTEPEISAHDSNTGIMIGWGKQGKPDRGVWMLDVSRTSEELQEIPDFSVCHIMLVTASWGFGTFVHSNIPSSVELLRNA